MSALRELLRSAIDYAGLFPPASLSMEAAVREYAEGRGGPHRWALARFVVPVARLDEFERAAGPMLSNRDPWPLTVLAGTDWVADVKAIGALGARNRGVVVESVEVKVGAPAEVERAAAVLRGGVPVFFEMPLAGPPGDFLAPIARAHQRAKVRTGGERPEDIPSSAVLARFLSACFDAGVAFKATAGLHHPVRRVAPLSPVPGSACARVHGFINLLLAAAFVFQEMDADEAAEVLDETDPAAFRFDEAGAAWGTRSVDARSVAQARRTFLLGFGSCSFREPIEALQRMGHR
jgi:hypothetical protein